MLLPRIALLVLLGPFAIVSCVARPAGPARLAHASGDPLLEQVTLRPHEAGVQLSARLVARGPLSPARRAVVVSAVAEDGTRRELGRARLRIEPARRSPPRHGREATFSVLLPAGADRERLEIALEPERPAR
jgi:hypothetical protein